MYHVFGSQNQIIIIILYPAILMAPLLMQFLISSSSLSSIIGVMFYNPYQQMMAQKSITIPPQANTTTTTTTSLSLTCENPTYGIRIQYPSDWQKLEFSRRDSLGIAVIFRSPPENASDTKLENLLIQVGNLPFQNISLEVLNNANIDNLRNSLVDFELVESTATTIAYNPAYKIIYTDTVGQDERKTMQVLSIKEDKVYLITYTAEASRYDRYLPTIQKMIDSFRLGDSGIIGV
jgi:hypothetical protein